MTRLALAVSSVAVVVVLFFACSPEPVCGPSFCGCWEDKTLTFSTQVTESDGGAVSGADVQCIGAFDGGSKPPTTTTDDGGSASFTFDTRQSPGCGWQNCNSVRVTRGDGGYKEFMTDSVNGKTATMP